MSEQVRGLDESVDYSVSVFAINQHGVGAGGYLEMKTKADGESAIIHCLVCLPDVKIQFTQFSLLRTPTICMGKCSIIKYQVL